MANGGTTIVKLYTEHLFDDPEDASNVISLQVGDFVQFKGCPFIFKNAALIQDTKKKGGVLRSYLCREVADISDVPSEIPSTIGPWRHIVPTNVMFYVERAEGVHLATPVKVSTEGHTIDGAAFYASNNFAALIEPETGAYMAPEGMCVHYTAAAAFSPETHEALKFKWVDASTPKSQLQELKLTVPPDTCTVRGDDNYVEPAQRKKAWPGKKRTTTAAVAVAKRAPKKAATAASKQTTPSTTPTPASTTAHAKTATTESPKTDSEVKVLQRPTRETLKKTIAGMQPCVAKDIANGIIDTIPEGCNPLAVMRALSSVMVGVLDTRAVIH
jgi:hypothetical protein